MEEVFVTQKPNPKMSSKFIRSLLYSELALLNACATVCDICGPALTTEPLVQCLIYCKFDRTAVEVICLTC